MTHIMRTFSWASSSSCCMRSRDSRRCAAGPPGPRLARAPTCNDRPPRGGRVAAAPRAEFRGGHREGPTPGRRGEYGHGSHPSKGQSAPPPELHQPLGVLRLPRSSMSTALCREHGPALSQCIAFRVRNSSGTGSASVLERERRRDGAFRLDSCSWGGVGVTSQQRPRRRRPSHSCCRARRSLRRSSPAG